MSSGTAAVSQALLSGTSAGSEGSCGQSSGSGALLRAAAEPALLTRLEQESVPTQEQLELEKQETALVMEYQRAEAREASVVINGQRRTLSGAQAAYRAGELTRQEYLETLHALYALRADELGDIFLRLVALRKEIAQSRGFSSFLLFLEVYDHALPRSFPRALAGCGK